MTDSPKALPTDLPGVKVRSPHHVLQVHIAIWKLLFQHDHGVRLAEEGSGCTQLPQLNQLQDNLKREVQRRVGGVKK